MDPKSPGSGERRARRGLRYQDRASALLAYQALLDGTLTFIALADDQAGMFDDLVIGIAGRVIGHQYKSSTKPKPIGVRKLLLGTENAVADCAASFVEAGGGISRKARQRALRHLALPSSADTGQFGIPCHDFADFLQEKTRNADRTLAEWRGTIWKPLIEELHLASGLAEADFDRFFTRFEIATGAPPSVDFNLALDSIARSQITELARALGDLIGREDGKTRWSRRELLDELGWADRFLQRFEHRFPLGAHVQSNEKSEADLEYALAVVPSGYLSLLGPPGAGKSTLLERFVRSGPDRIVVRYLAYMPDTALRQGRGEAENFLHDLNAQLVASGLSARRVVDATLEQQRETFESLIEQASRRFANSGQKTILVVDGLDHVPREQRPQTSFLRAFPLPQSVPEGVVFLLGSQRVDLADMPREVTDQALAEGRTVQIAALDLAAITDMVASVGLMGTVDPSRIFDICLGHPLIAQYLLGKLLTSDDAEREALLDGGFEYGGDLERVYRAAWREAQNADPEVSKVLFTLGFVEGPIEPELLAQCLSTKAVNDAHRIAHHLIQHSRHGWQVFHNSFRLFLREQTIQLFGKPDPDFSAPARYRRLAELARLAPASSVQRWLEFRYRFLAGDRAEASALASRQYFVGQFIDGRQTYEVNNDIRDAFACLETTHAPAQVFDLMLAMDEVWRRQDALSTAQNLVAAQIAAGELDLAEAQLDDSHSSGDEWLVIRALLKAGQADRARAIFDDRDPWRWFDGSHSVDDEDSPEVWADLAVVLLDDQQIERRIRKAGGEQESFMGETPEDYLRRLRFALARSTLRRDPERAVKDVATLHDIPHDQCVMLNLASADAKLAAGRHADALACLERFENCASAQTMHGSWFVRAARMARASGNPDLAKRLFAMASAPDLCNLEYASQEVGVAVRNLIRFAETAALLGEDEPQPPCPRRSSSEGYKCMRSASGRSSEC